MKMGYGAIAFLIGGALALVIGLGAAFNMYEITGTAATVVTWVLLVAGILVGLWNIDNAESVPFVVGVVGMTLLVGITTGVARVNEIVSAIGTPLITFLMPASIIVAAKMVFEKAKN